MMVLSLIQLDVIQSLLQYKGDLDLKMEALLPLILIAVVIGGIIYYFQRKSSERPKSREELTGIQGWLRLLAIGLVFNIIKIVSILQEALTSPETQRMFDQVDPTFMTVAIILDFLPLVLAVVLFILLISKHYQFKIFFLYSTAYVVAEPWLQKVLYLTFPFKPLPMSPEELSRYIAQVIFLIVWVAYVLKSKRVKYTFGY
jgi:hypothetical protein